MPRPGANAALSHRSPPQPLFLSQLQPSFTSVLQSAFLFNSSSPYHSLKLHLLRLSVLSNSSRKMDPASAAVAFVRFAASVSTLAGQLLRSSQIISQIIHDICKKFKGTPKELQDLSRQLRKLRALIQVLENRDLTRIGPSLLLKETWQDCLCQWKKICEFFLEC
jgi:hypothetical protein